MTGWKIHHLSLQMYFIIENGEFSISCLLSGGVTRLILVAKKGICLFCFKQIWSLLGFFAWLLHQLIWQISHCFTFFFTCQVVVWDFFHQPSICYHKSSTQTSSSPFRRGLLWAVSSWPWLFAVCKRIILPSYIGILINILLMAEILHHQGWWLSHYL